MAPITGSVFIIVARGLVATLEAWRRGEQMKVLVVGDSLAAGTSTTAGPREDLKFLLGDMMPFDYVGDKTTQQGTLATYGASDYQHSGVGGEKIADWTARIASLMTTYDPDFVIVIGGSNNYGQTNEATTTAHVQTFVSTLRGAGSAQKYRECPILWVLPTLYNSGGLYTDSNITAVINGIRTALLPDQDILVIDEHAYESDMYSATDFLDTVHRNRKGYYKIALAIARKLLGPLLLVPNDSAVKVEGYTAVASDKDFPTGAYFQATGGTFKVTTWGGTDITFVIPGTAGTNNGLAANTLHKIAITRLWSTGTTIGTNTFLAHVLPRFALQPV